LGQILHRFHQHLLSVHVAGIGGSFALFARQIRPPQSSLL
jgi:hypothetical protein